MVFPRTRMSSIVVVLSWSGMGTVLMAVRLDSMAILGELMF